MTYNQALKNCVVFSALSDINLDKIAALVVGKQYGAGTTLFNKGDSAEELFILQEGKVALQMTMPTTIAQSGRRFTVDVVTRNELIGWSAIVEPHSYTLTAVCLQEVKVLSISGNKLRWLLRDNPNIGYEVLKGLSKVVASRLDDTRQVLISERSLPLESKKVGSM